MEKQQSIGENIGREIGGAIGKSIEQEVQKAVAGERTERERIKEEAMKAGWWAWMKRADAKRKKGFKYPDAIFGVLFTWLFLWVAMSLERWGFAILTDAWPQLLDVIRITAITTIVTWVVLLFIHPRFIFFLGKTLMDVMSMWAMWATLQIFPFDFSVWGGWSWTGTAFIILTWIGLLFTFIMIIIRAWRLVLGKDFD